MASCQTAKKHSNHGVMRSVASLARRGQPFVVGSDERLKEAIEKKLFTGLKDAVKVVTSAEAVAGGALPLARRPHRQAPFGIDEDWDDDQQCAELPAQSCLRRRLAPIPGVLRIHFVQIDSRRTLSAAMKNQPPAHRQGAHVLRQGYRGSRARYRTDTVLALYPVAFTVKATDALLEVGT
jgi:hypothetical protein